eukprot:scaffold99703_cov19-Tisochrysis_lutea.AAC.1
MHILPNALDKSVGKSTMKAVGCGPNTILWYMDYNRLLLVLPPHAFCKGVSCIALWRSSNPKRAPFLRIRQLIMPRCEQQCKGHQQQNMANGTVGLDQNVDNGTLASVQEDLLSMLFVLGIAISVSKGRGTANSSGRHTQSKF